MALEATSSSLARPLCRRTGLGWGTPGSPTDKHLGRLTGLPHCMTPTRPTPRGHQAPKGTRAPKPCTLAAPQTHTQCTLTETWDQGGLLCLLHLKRGPHCKTKYELGILPPTSKLSRQRGGSRINPLNCSTNFPRGSPTAFSFALCPHAASHFNLHHCPLEARPHSVFVKARKIDIPEGIVGPVEAESFTYAPFFSSHC